MAIKKIDLFNCDCPSFMMVMPTHSNAEENNFNNAWCDLETHSKEELTIDGEAAFGQWMDLYSFLTSQGLVTNYAFSCKYGRIGRSCLCSKCWYYDW